MTAVVNVRGRKRADLEADPSFFYVGRSVRWTEWTTRSAFANPFIANMMPAQIENILRDGYKVRPEDTPLVLYERWLRARPLLVALAQTQLRGRTLGCWCCNYCIGDPIVTPCHAILLAYVAEGIETTVIEDRPFRLDARNR